MGMGGTPILLFEEGTKREQGKDAQYDNIRAAMTVADAVKSTLGPRGMDKMMISSAGDVIITNDGITILKEMDVQHPAARMMVEVARTLDEEAGDGTTTAAVLAGELLKKAIGLIDSDIHPTVIASGYRMASERAIEVLGTLGIATAADDTAALSKVAMTAMMSKAVTGSREHLADLAVKAVGAVAEVVGNRRSVDLGNIQIVKRQGGSMESSELVQGVILDRGPALRSMPKAVKDAKIALLSSALEVRKTEVSAEIKITETSQRRAFLEEEEASLRRMAGRLRRAGANVVISQKAIDDRIQNILVKEGVVAVQNVKAPDLEKLSKATGASIVDRPSELEPGDLGSARSVEARKVEDGELTFVTGCKDPKAVALLLRGGTAHVVDEVDRSLDDALNVVRLAVEDGQAVTGGGSTAVELSMRLRDYADSVGGREQMVVSAFADALEVVPATLAENAGLDPIDMLVELRNAHQGGKVNVGVNVLTGKASDMRRENVLEPMRANRQIISSAAEAAIMIIRIDDVISAKGSPRQESIGPE